MIHIKSVSFLFHHPAALVIFTAHMLPLDVFCTLLQYYKICQNINKPSFYSVKSSFLSKQIMLTKLAKKIDLGKNGKQIGGIRVPNNWKNSVSFFFFFV